MKLIDHGPGGTRRPFVIDPARPVGEGGAGRVYAHPLDRSLVIKIYKPDQLAAHADKVRAMLANPPDQQVHRHNGRPWVQIAWPQALVTDERGRFLGFTMPMVDFKASTEVDQLMQISDRKAERLPEAYQFRLYAARNIASLVTELHARGHHVIDMKPQNMRVYRDTGFIAMIDCDGFSVRGDNGRRFPAGLFTPSYLCPEGFTKNAAALDEDQDRFALAVLIFQLLNNGVHPFQGRTKPGRAHQIPDEIPPRIARGLYAHARQDNGPQGPHPMSLVAWMDDRTAEMFERAFAAGRLRPTAREWRDHLTALVGLLLQCPNSVEHQHFAKGCGLCALEIKAGRRPATQTKPRVPPKPVQMAVPPTPPSSPKVVPQARSPITSASFVRSVVLPILLHLAVALWRLFFSLGRRIWSRRPGLGALRRLIKMVVVMLGLTGLAWGGGVSYQLIRSLKLFGDEAPAATAVTTVPSPPPVVQSPARRQEAQAARPPPPPPSSPPKKKAPQQSKPAQVPWWEMQPQAPVSPKPRKSVDDW